MVQRERTRGCVRPNSEIDRPQRPIVNRALTERYSMRKRTKKKRKPYEAYVPLESGLWGRIHVTRAQAHYYYKLGFNVFRR